METIKWKKLKRLKCVLFSKGETVFREGAYASGVLYKCRKSKLSMTGDEGREQIVRLAKPGDIIGYKALLSSDRYSATAPH